MEELKIRKRSLVGCFLCLCSKRVKLILKACRYCGGIHKYGYVCKEKPSSIYTRNKKIKSFRDSNDWRTKRGEIRERDCNVCVACWHNLQGTIRRINSNNISVHHILSLVDAWHLRLCDDNLITLCEYHHQAAEKGEISAKKLTEILKIGVNISPL